VNFFQSFNLWNQPAASRKRPTRVAHTADIEIVEPRQMLAASALFLPSTGELSIEINSSDSVRVGSVNGRVQVQTSINGGPFQTVTSVSNVLSANVQRITILGGDDANTIDLSGVTAAAFPALTSIKVDGANGNDLLIGSPDFADSLIGGHGNDTIQGNGGADTLLGGDGSDVITGGTGNDSINAGDGDDNVSADDGDDTILAGDGQDTISGGNGNDTIEGANGQDSLLGDAGNDTINGDGGTDTLDGGDGDDLLFGGELNDSLLGGAGNDDIQGQSGNDTLDGGAGNDSLLGGVGHDSILGNDGDDLISAGGGNDNVDGGAGNDSLYGGAGNDSLFGNIGDDVVFGQGGDDSMNGGNGADLLNGGTGNDFGLADDAYVGIVSSFSAVEGSGNTTVMQFVVGLSSAALVPVSVDFTTVNGTATAGSDYLATSGTLVFQPGEVSRTIDVTIIGDQVAELNETFSVVLSNVQGALLGNGLSSATIVNDDVATLFINDVNRLEGDPVVQTAPVIRPGFNSNTLAPNDDGSTGAVPLGFTINFFGTLRNNVFVNNNGNVTFNGPLASFTPFPILTTGVPILAPFFADVDTTVGSSSPVTYGQGTVGSFPAFGVNWIDVGFFGGGATTPTNDFQLVLIDRSDISPGDFDIEFNYGAIRWEAGTASGGNQNGLGGNTARVGFSNGTTIGVELPGSAVPGAFLDTGPAATSLVNNSLNSGLNGRYIFLARNGIISTVAGPTLTFTVDLSIPSAVPVAVDFTVTDGTATSIVGGPTPQDYGTTSGRLFFAPGVTSQTITVFVASDTDSEADETFTVNLSNPINATITDGTGVGTIINDDGPNPPSGGNSSTTNPVPPPVTNPNVTVLSGPASFGAALSGNQSETIVGGDGNDFLIGGGADDVISGGGGADFIDGNTGNDSLLGGSGNDTLLGNLGNDTLDGQGGNDSLNGGDGDDTFLLGNKSGGHDTADGGDGRDDLLVVGTGNADVIGVDAVSGLLRLTKGTATLTASANVETATVNALGGDDVITVSSLNGVLPSLLTINGGDGDDSLSAAGAEIGRVRLVMNGDAGNDTVIGSLGNDSLFGGDGMDQMNGLAGDDVLQGQAGNDTIGGGDGNDTIGGGDGIDFLTGQNGDDSITGGTGNDTLRGMDGNDTLAGQAGDDILNGMDGDDSVLGGTGQDAISGGAGNDTLDGGRNDDTINGNSGNDKIRGDHGNDYINAGTGSDTVNGGDGHDTIIATDGFDLLNGGDGNDSINAGDGNDILTGGDGNDTLLGGAGNDILLGGDGDDVINGQGATDTVAGNQGIDVIADPASEIDENFVLSDELLTLLEAI
jgi:Ca2+-binding RTX toxin-like protein